MRLHLSITLQLLRSNSIGENNKILEMKTVLVIVSALSIGQLAYAVSTEFSFEDCLCFYHFVVMKFVGEKLNEN